MIITLKITRIWIEHIDKIEVGEIEPTFMKRHITITTKDGERFELVLEAETSQELEFKKPDESWLTPKVYKGKSMAEEEEA